MPEDIWRKPTTTEASARGRLLSSAQPAPLGNAPEEIWRLPRVLAATGMGRTWTYDEIARGTFPAPVRLGLRAVGWRRSDVEAWLQSREAKVA